MDERDPLHYGTEVDIGPNARTYMLEMVGRDRDVLELGCGAGAMTRVMAEYGCRVVGVELDPVAAEHARPAADDVLVGDLADLDLAAKLGDRTFDVLVFGDVLEHLPDPVTVLRNALPLLRQDGSIIISVPNIAHGDVRLALLAGRFEYTPIGLLDSTHLRFFTKSSMLDLLRDAGLVALEIRRAEVPLFSTELDLDPAAYDPSIVEQLREDVEAQTYQFVVRAVPADWHEDLRKLADRAEAADQEAERLRAERVELNRRLDEVLDEVGRLRVSEAEARLHMAVLTTKVMDLEGAADAIAMMRMSRIVRWTRPVRHAVRRLRPRRGRGSEPDASPDSTP